MPATNAGTSSPSSVFARLLKRSSDASASTTATLANSLGWIEKPGKAYQRRAPLISGAKNGNPSRAKTATA